MGFLYSQLIVRLPYPEKSFNGQTIIVTGSNTGLGLEAARHFVRLGASKIILACRSQQKGLEAQKSIEATTHRLSVCEVWQLDMEDWDSVKTFARRADKLERLDAIVENAGVALMGPLQWSKKAGMETTIAVNVSAEKYGIVPRLCITSSEVHGWAKFLERNEPSIFEALKKDNPKYLEERYSVSKLLEVLTVHSLAREMKTGPHASQKVILNTLNPGFCHSELARDATGFMRFQMAIMKLFLARTTEVGSRTLVSAVLASKESHGMYMGDCAVTEPSPFVRSEDGVKTGERVYEELMEILEGIQPGITKNI